ncbi:hypothetical protein, partial [Pseudomonas syringae group genomosp. 7]|uniref:hypothetical protein n=1 Tax=Pseudomonas syringae group genomosp. 7 TaxID=251699 RepID=UPI00376FBC9A
MFAVFGLVVLLFSIFYDGLLLGVGMFEGILGFSDIIVVHLSHDRTGQHLLFLMAQKHRPGRIHPQEDTV